MTYRDKRCIDGFRAFAPPPALMAAFLSIVLAACTTAGFAGEQRTPSSGVSSLQGCGLREISRQRLTAAGGRPLYVEADAFVADGRGNVLLAGTPNYLWKISPQGEIIGLTADSVIGAVIARDGTAHLIPAPMSPEHIHAIRAAARPEGGWDVVFAEIFGPPDDSRTAARLWYGALHGGRWSALEELPMPRDVALNASFTSSLVRLGDTLAWALTPAIGASRRDISLFQRVGGRWTHETVPTGTAVDVDLAYSDSLGLIAAVVQPDPTLMADGNSLLLWAGQPDWQIVRRLVHGDGEGRVHDPSLVHAQGKLLASWWSPVGEGTEFRHEMRARYLGPLEVDEPAMVVDSNVSLWSDQSPMVLQGGIPLWASLHGGPGEGVNELRFAAVAAREPFELARFPSPYLMWTDAVEQAPGEVIVTGMEYKENRFAFSLLIRLRIDCERTP